MKRTLLIVAAVLLLLPVVLILPHCHADLPPADLQADFTYPESRFLEVEGMRVHYRDQGNGPALVLLHGTGASLHTWEAWTRRLESDFRVISMDLPAFGLTGPHPRHDYSPEAYVAFLDAFAGQLGLDSFHLAGNSLGGLIAWRYAATYPSRVRKLILLDPAGFPQDRPAALAFRLARNPLTASLLLRVTPRKLYRKTLEEVYVDDRKVTEALVDRYFTLALREGNRQAFVDRMQQSTPVDTNDLRKLSHPVLLQWGREDEWIPVADARRFQELLPRDTLIVYERVGHVPMEEAPDITADDARHFLLDDHRQ